MNKNCKNNNCDINFIPSRPEQLFCSSSCAAKYNNSRRKPRSVESRQKTSSSMKQFFEKNYENIDFSSFTERLKEGREQWQLRCKEELINGDFDSFGYDRKRKRIIIEQENKCNKCGLGEWLGEVLVLEIDHKDGDNTNDVRENMEGLCPNCHSLTLTWRGRNRSDKRIKVTDEELLDAFIETGNIRQALIKVGLTPKGGNYGRIKRILTTKQII